MPDNQSAVPVSQRARDAAAALHLEIEGSPHSEHDLFEAEQMRAGEADNWPEVQAFAAFERDILAGQSVGDYVLREAAKRLSDVAEACARDSNTGMMDEAILDVNQALAASHTAPDVLREALEKITAPLGVEPEPIDGYSDAECAKHWRKIAIAYRECALTALATPAPSRNEVEKLRDALLPFASMAATDDTDGVNMNDPLKKWITIGQLQAAREALNKDTGDE